ncbi:MAG: FGGY family carbohydrate kinase, partial [Oceanobacter sp.]
GTVDSFLIWRLSGGTSHVTDATNASRTMLFDIHKQCWDQKLLDLFTIPPAMLPTVLDCAAEFGVTDAALLGVEIPILGVAGDQQAASIGQCCFEKGQIKSTYGTGCFVLLNTGDELLFSQQRLLSTVAWQFNGQRAYALEGSIFIAGAVVQWLRDQLGLVDSAAETESLAASIDSTQGVYLVPAFTGLGVPYWRADVRGALTGLTRGAGKAEIVRAALESVCYQTNDLFSAMEAEGMKPLSLRVDGGMVANDWMLQFMADILDMEVLRPAVLETTALGAAYLAGRQAGFYGDFEDFNRVWRCTAEFHPAMEDDLRQKLLSGWKGAIQKVLN